MRKKNLIKISHNMRRFARFGTISQFIKREKHPSRSVIASKGKVSVRNFEK